MRTSWRPVTERLINGMPANRHALTAVTAPEAAVDVLQIAFVKVAVAVVKIAFQEPFVHSFDGDIKAEVLSIEPHARMGDEGQSGLHRQA